MKRLFDFLIKANQVLLFLTLVGAIALAIYILCQTAATHYETPHVSIAQTPEEEKKVVVSDVRFLSESGGIYLFGIEKREITEPGPGGIRMISSLSREDNEGQIVNVVFSKGSKTVKTLLKADGLVVDNNLSGQYYSDTNFTPYLFMCVTEDTDGNHVLDTRDREDLYIVARDLSTPDIVIKGASSFNIISATHLVVKTGTGEKVQFLDVDTKHATQKEVEWK
ncbi:MAG TPA: hypothetical protein VMJ12_02170 [Candidatus Acidoferrales bacterium]|nr:hypothetical protein [Candidatus Acidoferrales bacterium]